MLKALSGPLRQSYAFQVACKSVFIFYDILICPPFEGTVVKVLKYFRSFLSEGCDKSKIS